MLKSSFYNTVGAGIRLVVSVFTIPLLIRLIGIDEYGLLALVLAIANIVALAEAGLSLATTVFVARDLAQNNIQGVAETMIIIGTALLVLASSATLAVFISIPFASGWFPNFSVDQRTAFTTALSISTVVIWGRLLQQASYGLLQAYQRFGILNILQTAQAISISIGSLLIAVYGGKVVAILQWQALVTLTTLLACLLTNAPLFKENSLVLRWNRLKAFEIGRYSLSAWVGSLGSALFSQFDRVIVGALLGSTSLGVYAAITTITVQINTFSAMAVQPYFPIITSLLTQPNNLQAIRSQVRQAWLLNVLIALGMGVLLISSAPFLLPLLLHQVSQVDILTFRILAIIYSMYSVNAVGTYILYGSDKVWLSTLTIIVCGGGSLLMIAFGSQNLGIIGAALGNTMYIGIGIITLAGMRLIQIPLIEWIGWVKWLLTWFLLSVIFTFVLPDEILTAITITLIQITVLFWITFHNYHDLFFQFLHRLTTKLSRV